MENLPEGLASSNAGKIAQKLGTVSAGRVLDVATGRGGFIDTLMKTLKAYDSFVGIDYCPSNESKKDMESAKKRFEGKPVQFLQMNAENLEFEDESFDTVSISHSLHHLANIDRVMTEMKRVLKRVATSYSGRCMATESKQRHRKWTNLNTHGRRESTLCLASLTIEH